MALTDAQWAAAQVEINAKLIAGTITEQQAITQLTAATEDWPTRTLSNADLAARVSRFLARLNGLILTNGPPDVTLGELNTFAYDTANGVLYGPKTAAGWGSGVSLVGPAGLSAKQVVINAGLLPEDATDADFATWLADAQIDKVQPLVDAAGVSAATASTQAANAGAAATAAAEARTGAETARTGAEAAAQDTAADRLATDADRQVVASERTATEAAALTAAGHAGDAASAAGLSVAAQGLSEAAATAAAGSEAAAGASAAAASADALATDADRQAVATDKAAVAADRAASEAAAATATTKAAEAVGSAGDADTARIAAVAAQVAAEQARDEAEAIAGGDFVTGPTSSTDGRLAVFAGATGKAIKEGPAFGVGTADDVLRRSDGDGRYRAAGDVPLAEVTGLGDALETKADLVEGKVPVEQLPAPPTVPAFATVAEVRAGTADGKIIAPKVMADALAAVAVTPATAAAGLDFSGFINAEIALTGNLTVGPPSGGFARKTGEIDFVYPASGSAAVAFHADCIVPANFSLQATANGRTSVPYRYQANGKVRLYNPSKWSA